MSYATARRRDANSEANKLYPEDRSVHEWYRFVLSFPPHLVRTYLERFEVGPFQRVLDPFCGTGTVLVECKKHGIPSVGIEANPMAHFASRVKVDWEIDPTRLVEQAEECAEIARARLRNDGIDDEGTAPPDSDDCRALEGLSEMAAKLLLTGSISPLPLHKTLVLLDVLSQHRSAPSCSHERLALAKALVRTIGNLRFGPEVGAGQPKSDAPVISSTSELPDTESWRESVLGIPVDYDADLAKHYVRMFGWLPICRDYATKVGKRHVRYFTLCAAGAVDVFMLERAGVLYRSPDGLWQIN